MKFNLTLQLLCRNHVESHELKRKPRDSQRKMPRSRRPKKKQRKQLQQPLPWLQHELIRPMVHFTRVQEQSFNLLFRSPPLWHHLRRARDSKARETCKTLLSPLVVSILRLIILNLYTHIDRDRNKKKSLVNTRLKQILFIEILFTIIIKSVLYLSIRCHAFFNSTS